jgi:hypothetical protein
LTITGVTFNSAGLRLSTIAAGGFQTTSTITTAEAAINTAITTVRAQTETFGTNASRIQTRQNFEQNMINTLQTGASNLVLADQNQEKRQPADPANPTAIRNLVPAGELSTCVFHVPQVRSDGASKAYATTAKEIANPRELEANLLLKAAARLQAVKDT